MPRRLRVGWPTYLLDAAVAGYTLTGIAAALNYVTSGTDGVVPQSPYWLRATGSTSSQKTLDWKLPVYLMNGTDVSENPLTAISIYWSDEQDQCNETGLGLGNCTRVSIAADQTSITLTSLPTSGTLYATVVAVNASGEGYPTPEISWTAT